MRIRLSLTLDVKRSENPAEYAQGVELADCLSVLQEASEGSQRLGFYMPDEYEYEEEEEEEDMNNDENGDK